MTPRTTQSISWTLLIAIVGAIVIPAIVFGSKLSSDIDVSKVNDASQMMIMNKYESSRKEDMNELKADIKTIGDKQDSQSLDIQKIKDKLGIK